MKRSLLALVAFLGLLAGAVRASGMPSLDVNGHSIDGVIYEDRGQMYVNIDIVGPQLFGAGFQLLSYDYTLRRITFDYLPIGGSASKRLEIFGCFKRVAVFVPLKPLMDLVGGRYEEAGDVVHIAYPPVAAVSVPVAPSPTVSVIIVPPPPAAPPSPATPPSPAAPPLPAAPSPPAAPPIEARKPVNPATPAPVVAVHMPGAPTTAVEVRPSPITLESPSPTPQMAGDPKEIALAEVKSANRDALNPTGLIQKVEVYHPGFPDPSDAIPKTEVAGLKVYVKQLAPSDTVNVQMWPNRDGGGEPAFKTQLSGFHGEELEQNAFFVRLPLTMAAGWHTVRLEYNHEAVVYHFVTY